MKDEFQEKLDQLRATEPATSCFKAVVWRQLAEDLLAEPQAANLVEHATRCDGCALLLRKATQEVAEEEAALLASLRWAQQEGPKELARGIIAERKRQQLPQKAGIDPVRVSAWRRALSVRFAWAYAAAALVLVLGGIFWVQTLRALSVDKLIARAYTDKRPFELRIDGAAHSDISHTRINETPKNFPVSLLRAEVLVREQLAARPSDSGLLAAQARIRLLQGDYEEARRSLGRLLDAQPESPELLKDLAIAYFQRAAAGDRAIDYGQAIELLGRALAKNPDDPTALFNRAIALEKMHAYNEAIRDWEHYLRVDSKGPWNEEAQDRLDKLRLRMKEREKPAALLRSNPAEAATLLRARATGQGETASQWAASLDEAYLDLAVREWLPELFLPAESKSTSAVSRNPAIEGALQALSDALLRHHQDRWLADLLAELHTSTQARNALESLARAARANAAGDPDSARPLAESAAMHFHAANNAAGYLLARKEIVYSFVRSSKMEQCLPSSRLLAEDERLDSYPWLKIQVILFHAACQGSGGDPDLAQRLSQRALEFTRGTGYAGLNLRSVLFAAGFLRSTERNWQDTRQAQGFFWSNWHDPFHAYESYVELAILAEDADWWHLARHFRQEALGMIQQTPDRAFRAVAHFRLGVAAQKLGDAIEAEREIRIACQEFADIPATDALRRMRATSEVALAGIEIQQGRVASAENLLVSAEPLLKEIPDSWTTFHYFQTLGQTEARKNNFAEAEAAFWDAISIGEGHLKSLQTDSDRLAWEQDASRAYRALAELYARKGDSQFQALEIWEWYRASALRDPTPATSHSGKTAELSENGGRPTLSLVRSTLPLVRHETVITFARLPSGVAVWAFDDRGVKFAWIGASDQELASRSKRFASLCSDLSSDMTRLRNEASELYELLIAPVEQWLNAERVLIIEPDSYLSMVPWPALLDRRGEFLGARFAIVISPGLGYWDRLRPPPSISTGKRVLVVGMPALTPETALRFPPLPHADAEAQAIASRFTGARLLKGTRVTSREIQREMAGSEIFHFAGHSIARPNGSGLLLASAAENGEPTEPMLLSSSDIAAKQLGKLQLVVLSACATAESEKGFTDPNTLVRGFLRAGVPHVVASRWPVDSRTTAEAMKDYYERLLQGQSSAVALKHVSDTQRSITPTAHPYYWAAFAAFGR